jgi:hypothetical protein
MTESILRSFVDLSFRAGVSVIQQIVLVARMPRRCAPFACRVLFSFPCVQSNKLKPGAGGAGSPRVLDWLLLPKKVSSLLVVLSLYITIINQDSFNLL